MKTFSQQHFPSFFLLCPAVFFTFFSYGLFPVSFLAVGAPATCWAVRAAQVLCPFLWEAGQKVTLLEHKELDCSSLPAFLEGQGSEEGACP